MMDAFNATVRLRNSQREVRSPDGAIFIARDFADELASLLRNKGCCDDVVAAFADEIAHDADVVTVVAGVVVGVKVFLMADLVERIVTCLEEIGRRPEGCRGKI